MYAETAYKQKLPTDDDGTWANSNEMHSTSSQLLMNTIHMDTKSRCQSRAAHMIPEQVAQVSLTRQSTRSRGKCEKGWASMTKVCGNNHKCDGEVLPIIADSNYIMTKANIYNAWTFSWHPVGTFQQHDNQDIHKSKVHELEDKESKIIWFWRLLQNHEIWDFMISETSPKS